MPNKKTPKPKPLYRRQPEKSHAKTPRHKEDTVFHEIAPSHFELRDDGSILSTPDSQPSTPNEPFAPRLLLSSDAPFVRLYHADCLTLLDAIAAKYPQGRFDAIFADPPYFLSNGGITCHAGRMVKVDKGDWDKSRGPEINHEFNKEWLKRCQKVLKPNGTIWVSGTHHVIFSIGYAMQQLGYKILNDIAWEKPNPPPNLSCRYFTHSTETILWAAKNEKSKHLFNYQDMRKVTGKQMKTVWRAKEFEQQSNEATKKESENLGPLVSSLLNPVWTMSAPGNDEKKNGKHPTQKPVALIERCLLASTNPGDLVLDPFLGGGTTAIAAIKLKRGCVGIELNLGHLSLAMTRVDKEIISIWLRHFRVQINISVCWWGESLSSPDIVSGGASVPASRPQMAAQQHSPAMIQKDLDLFSNSINGSRVDDKPQVPTERIFHECKFVFLSCAEVERGAVVHTTVDVSLQEAWAKTPNGKKRETTHIVRCETEIFRITK